MTSALRHRPGRGSRSGTATIWSISASNVSQMRALISRIRTLTLLMIVFVATAMSGLLPAHADAPAHRSFAAVHDHAAATGAVHCPEQNCPAGEKQCCAMMHCLIALPLMGNAEVALPVAPMQRYLARPDLLASGAGERPERPPRFS